jgi:hypothetical protein
VEGFSIIAVPTVLMEVQNKLGFTNGYVVMAGFIIWFLLFKNFLHIFGVVMETPTPWRA